MYEICLRIRFQSEPAEGLSVLAFFWKDYGFTGRSAKRTPSGGVVFLFYVLTGRVLFGRPSGGDIFLFFVFTSRVRQLATSGGTIFLCLKKDSGERQTKGAAAPVGSPG